MRIVVIGAGVVGVAAAWALRRAGAEVIVVEAREGPALETSFANAGHLAVASGPWAAPDVPGKLLRWLGREDAPLLLRPRWDPALWRWGLRFLANCTAAAYEENARAIGVLAQLSCNETIRLREELAIADDANREGVLTLYRDPRGLAAAEKKRDRLAAQGIAAELLDRDGMVAREPALARAADRYAGALFAADAETADCRAFTLALAAEGERRGVVFRFRARVAEILVEGGRARGVALEGGEHAAADAVVLAAGPWSVRLARPLGLRLPIYPGKGYSVTVPIDGRNGAPRLSVVDEADKVYVARFGERLRLAGTLELAGFDPTPSLKRAAATLDRLRALFPEGGDYTRAEHWTGLRPMTPDGRPLIGATPVRGLWLDTGHGPLGWTLACGSALLLASLIAGSPPPIDATPFALSRF
ncbi:MAG: D-amino acid dehydrogenase [Elioraea sp.]|nr:D-amino acid dehydrogenase [Elioraea sp.]